MAYTKAQAEAQKNALLASGQPIPANLHRQFEQVLIDELYDAQATGNKLKDVQNAVASVVGDKVLIIRTNGQGYLIDDGLLPGSGGGTFTIDVVSASTVGGTVTFDFASTYERIFFGSASFSTPKTIALSNDTNAVKLDFTLNITNVAGVLTFPSTFIMDDVRWNTSTQGWTPEATGKYKGSAFFDGTNWLLEISQPYV